MRHTRLIFALALGAAACVTGPYNGTTTSGSVIGKKFLFEGYWNHPSTPISLQVMIDPTRDPALASSWVQFATANTDATPVTVNSTDPLYFWSVTAAPVPIAAFGARWPSGGLIRVRAFNVASNYELTSFDDVTFPDCLTAQLAVNADWVTIGSKCAGLGGTALVSTDFKPTPTVGFLSRKGKITQQETKDYYEAIDAPQTLLEFKSLNGFSLTTTPASGEVTATYYNDGDLGLGREMHCKAPPSGGVACYVTNYTGTANTPVFGDDPVKVLGQAIAHSASYATVAMTYDGAASSNPVKFMVYGTDGKRLNIAQLDSNPNGNLSVPNNCLSCHGIESSYNKSTKVVSGAQFLPFDPFSYVFSTDPSYTFPAQANKFRQLNSLVLHTFPSPGIVEYITGLYAPNNIDNIHAVANPAYIPDAWQNGNASQDGTAIYNGVVKFACRTCHLSAINPLLEFTTPDGFAAFANLIRNDACGNHEMPHAERVRKKFWESGARAYLTAYFNPASYPDPLQACK